MVQSVPLCPLSMESVLAEAGLRDTVRCFSGAVEHVVRQAFDYHPLSFSSADLFSPPLGFTG